MNLPVSNIGPELKVGPDYIEVENLIVQNPELANLLREVPVAERVPLFLKIVRFGTETFQFFSTTAAAEKLKAVSLEITQDVGTKKDEIISGIEGIATRLTSENDPGSINKLLKDWRTEFSALLSNNFDEKNKESIISKFDSVLRSAGEAQNAAVINKLDFNVPESAINVLQKNLKDYIKSEIGAISTSIGDLKTLIKTDEASKDATAAEKKLQANRGKVFEDQVFEILEDIARSKGDIADNPGPTAKKGLDGNDEGDLTVQIDPSLTGGAPIVFVVECKLRKNRMSDKALYEELDKGISNRGAKVGFIITEPKDSANLSSDFFHEGTKGRAILDMDPLNPDVNALRFAYLWARWECLKDEAKVLDSNAVKAALTTIKISLGTLITAKSNNTKAIGLLDSNASIIEGLEKNVKAEIQTLESLIRAVEEESEEG